MNFPPDSDTPAVSGETYDFFPMPPMEFSGITTSADLFGMFNDTPQAASLMRYLVTVEAQSIWPSRGGAVSGNSAVPLDVYPDETSMRLAEALNSSRNGALRRIGQDAGRDGGRLPDRDPQLHPEPRRPGQPAEHAGGGARDGIRGDQRGQSARCNRTTADDAGLGGEINILAVWADAEQESFEAVIAPWVERTGVTVNYESTRDINATLTTRLEGGNPPDVAGLPGPGAMAQFARSGDVLSLENVIDTDAMAQEWNEGLITDGSVDGHLVGIFIKVSPKGFIWYNPERFTEKNYEVPEDFAGLDALVEQIKADGTTPWGIGLNSGAGSEGWPGTDWIEDFVLRQSGPDVYDAWWQGTQAWNSAEIKEAFEAFGKWSS